jgi:hypothetical protein
MQTAAAERMRRMRARRAGTSPLLFERDDWRLLIEARSWAQKAGCQPGQVGRVIIKELVENALDSGAAYVSLTGNSWQCIIEDDGPSIAAADVTRLFVVNRPLRSSKLKRLPTRGMLGHGLRVVMGAVAAYSGKISVASRGQEFDLDVNVATGATAILSERAAVISGTRVTVHFHIPIFNSEDFDKGNKTIAIASSTSGVTYTDLSKPDWYSISDLVKLFAAAPKKALVSDVLDDVFGLSSQDYRKQTL